MLNNLQPETPLQNVERFNQSVGLWVTDSMAGALMSAAKAHRRTMSGYVRLALEDRLRAEGFLHDDRGVAA